MNDTFDAVRWRPVFSQNEMVGVWEEIGDESEWRSRIEMYHDGQWYLGRVLSLGGTVAEYIEQYGGDQKNIVERLYDALYAEKRIELDEDCDIAAYEMSLCDGDKFVVMLNDYKDNYTICTALFRINEDGTLLYQKEEDGSYSVLARQNDRYISAVFRGAAEGKDDWLPITSCKQIIGVWEEISNEQALHKKRYEIYNDAQYYSGLSSTHYETVRDQATALGIQVDEAWQNIAALEYYYENIKNSAIPHLTRYMFGLCPSYKFVQMYEFDHESTYFDYGSYQISRDGSRIRGYDAERQCYQIFMRQEESAISAAFRESRGGAKTWQPITSYQDIVGVWEQQDDDFWHIRYEIYEDGSYYAGNASNHLPAVTARVGDTGLSVLEAWDSIFKELETENRRELDSNEDIIDYAIGKCSGFTYAEMYEHERSDQELFTIAGGEMSAEGNRMRFYNPDTGTYDVYIRKEGLYISQTFRDSSF